MVIEEPEVVEEAVIVEEPRPVRQRARVVQQAVVVQEPVVIGEGGIYEEDARAIAMMNGMVEIDEVDENWRGNFQVEGSDASGDDLEITIDADTGAVLDIDD